MNKETLYELRNLVALYPYYQTARILMLRNMYLLHDSAFDDELRRVRLDKEEAASAQEFERAAQLRDEEKQLEEQRAEAEKRFSEEGDKELANITEVEIADVVSMSTGVPVSNLTEAEADKLLRMEGVLHERIIGQEEAITALSKAIRRSRSGLKDPKRPSGSFIFLGPSGVGKTVASSAR